MRSSADDEAPLKILSFLFSPNQSKHNKRTKPLINITVTKKKGEDPQASNKVDKVFRKHHNCLVLSTACMLLFCDFFFW